MPSVKSQRADHRVTASSPDDQGETVIMPRGQYITRKMREQSKAKRSIAEQVAAEYIKDFDAVLLDAGSTSELIAERDVCAPSVSLGSHQQHGRLHSIHARTE